MPYLVFILVTFALLAGFLILSGYETRRGSRLFARERAHLDRDVERLEFIVARVDLAAFLREESLRILRHIAHDIARVSLQTVRLAERFLSRIVRRLRAQRAIDPAPHENAREFVKTLSDFKDQLKESPPEVPDVY